MKKLMDPFAQINHRCTTSAGHFRQSIPAWLLACFCLLFLAACTQTSTVTPVSKPNFDYSIIKITKIPENNCLLDVSVDKKINETALAEIAQYIKAAEGANCSILFIDYYLPGQNPDMDKAWASSQFTPELEVIINNPASEVVATQAVSTQAVSAPITDQNLMGTWVDAGILTSTMKIKKVAGSYTLTEVFGDGSGGTVPLYVERVNGEDRLYEDLNNAYGDYMVILDNGYLAFYDDQGFIKQIPPR